MGRVWIHSVNCGPANTTDLVLARLDHEELRQWVELGLTGTEVCTITGWVNTIINRLYQGPSFSKALGTLW